MNGQEWIRSMMAFLIRLLSGASPRLSGWTPSLRPAVFFANHSSHLDAIIIWAMMPPQLRRQLHPVAARDYWIKNRLRRWLARDVFGAILIDRHGLHQIEASLGLLHQAIDRGESLIIFPEGTRGDGVNVAPFKSGLYDLARHGAQVDFVPVYLQNLNRILPKGEFLPVPFLGCAVFGAPLHLNEGEDKKSFLQRAHRAVTALSPEGSS